MSPEVGLRAGAAVDEVRCHHLVHRLKASLSTVLLARAWPRPTTAILTLHCLDLGDQHTNGTTHVHLQHPTVSVHVEAARAYSSQACLAAGFDTCKSCTRTHFQWASMPFAFPVYQWAPCFAHHYLQHQCVHPFIESHSNNSPKQHYVNVCAKLPRQRSIAATHRSTHNVLICLTHEVHRASVRVQINRWTSRVHRRLSPSRSLKLVLTVKKTQVVLTEAIRRLVEVSVNK